MAQDPFRSRIDAGPAAPRIDASGPLPARGADLPLPSTARARRRLMVLAVTAAIFVGSAGLSVIPTGTTEVEQEVKRPGAVSVGPAPTERATLRKWGVPFTALTMQASRDNATINVKARGLLGNLVVVGALFGLVGFLFGRRRPGA